jgi:methylmalonyl-CoA mutase|tara:strand:+ start:6988 stop:8358 length:1371 start_codon:yes stop_codon:yes gene_type:complete
MSKSTLFEDFESTSAKQWKQKIQFDLQGKDFNDTLVWKSHEGIDVKPFYHSEAYSKSPKIEYNSSDWKIGHSIYVSCVEKSNTHALELIENGVNSLYFILPIELSSLDALLKNIDLSCITIYFETLFLSENFITNIQQYLAHKNSKIYILNDPIGHLAKSGNWIGSLKTDIENLKKILISAKDLKGVLSVDLGLFQNAGSSMVQQLAYALAHVNEYLNLCDNKLIKVIVFKVSVGSNYFFEIAKLQALRILWQSLTKEYGISINCHIISQPTRRNKTIYDYNTNMLRTTTECMSAILGSSDTILNMPYDHIYHKDNEFGDRISRNQLLILKNESYFDVVSNPTEGVYYIETLTQGLAQKSLDLFKDIEKQGGYLKLLKEGVIQKKIKAHALKEQQSYDQGNEGLLGTHFQQNPSDKMKNELELFPFIKQQVRKTLIEPIIPRRIAEELEQKRLKDE